MPRPLENLIASWTVPSLGVLRDTPIHELQPAALHDALNVVTRNGRLEPRPGMTTFVGTPMTGRPTGAYNAGLIATGAFQADAFQNDAFQMAGNVPASTLLVGTTRKIYAFFAGTFNDITNGTLSATDAQLSRFAGLYHLSTALFQILHVNGVDTVRRWDTQSATTVDVPAAPSTMTDIASIADHFVGIIPPYQVRWSNNQDFATWPAANVRAISDRGDPLVAIRSMGQYSAVAYGSRSLWQMFPSGQATESIFFTFQNRGSFDGPAGTQAVVDANGVHYWMTDSGRVGMFDGNSVQWVADGVWPIVDDDLDDTNTTRIFGVYEPTFKEVWFFYPRVGDSGNCNGGVCVVLPRPADGIMQHVAFPVRFPGMSLSAAVDLRLDVRKSLVFGGGGQSDLLEGAQDRSATNFTGFWQTGLKATENQEVFGVSAFDVFTHRGANFGTLSAQVVSSYTLDTEDGTLSPTTTIDLTTTKVVEPFGKDVRGRFFGMRFSFSTPVTLRFLGARLAADPRLG